MKTNIRKIGNSAGMILPAVILKKLHLSEGDEIEISENGNQILLTPKQNKPKYTLKELLAQCDLKAPMPEAVKEWDEVQPAGLESL
ncbi:MAG: AbrB/MazE/SpoVT family DNA-binding domain-containing protein [Gammaproteobacteria bacterium]|nr:AbrB/MazE/SpoVT family DNA-binding domain-containing protein [Gammaproteobacteria bacterium]